MMLVNYLLQLQLPITGVSKSFKSVILQKVLA